MEEKKCSSINIKVNYANDKRQPAERRTFNSDGKKKKKHYLYVHENMKIERLKQKPRLSFIPVIIFFFPFKLLPNKTNVSFSVNLLILLISLFRLCKWVATKIEERAMSHGYYHKFALIHCLVKFRKKFQLYERKFFWLLPLNLLFEFP